MTKSLLTAALLLLTCAAATAASFIERRDVLIMRGAIEEGDHQRFVEKLASRRYSRLRVSSTGGLGREAMKIAEDISLNGITLEVVGPCTSSCAQFLAEAAPHVVINGGYLGFHAGMLSVVIAAREALLEHKASNAESQQRYGQTRDKLLSEMNALQREITEFERSHGIDPALSDFYRDLTSTRRVSVSINDQRQQINLTEVTGAACALWVPDRTGLIALGIKLDSPYEPPAREQISRDVGVPANHLYLGPPFPIRPDADLDACTTSQ